MEKIYQELLKSIGEDLKREGLNRTPQRAFEAFRFLTRGYNQNLEKVVNRAVFKTESRDMIILKNIEIYSLCEHHLYYISLSLLILPSGFHILYS